MYQLCFLTSCVFNMDFLALSLVFLVIYFVFNRIIIIQIVFHMHSPGLSYSQIHCCINLTLNIKINNFAKPCTCVW